MTTTLKTEWRRDLLADLERTTVLLERLTAIVERDVPNKEFPSLTRDHIGLTYLRLAETASRLAHELHLTTY